jgi:hypothetical protein
MFWSMPVKALAATGDVRFARGIVGEVGVVIDQRVVELRGCGR